MYIETDYFCKKNESIKFGTAGLLQQISPLKAVLNLLFCAVKFFQFTCHQLPGSFAFYLDCKNFDGFCFCT